MYHCQRHSITVCTVNSIGTIFVVPILSKKCSLGGLHKEGFFEEVTSPDGEKAFSERRWHTQLLGAGLVFPFMEPL